MPLFSIVTGKPFKQPIYWNIPMVILIIVWIIVSIFILIS